MKIAIIGLGKMGHQIAQKLVSAGHSVIGYDPVPAAVASAAQLGTIPATTKADVIANFHDAEPVILWLMIPADYVEAELTDWLGRLSAGSIIIDGGNSDFRLTQTRADRAAAQQINYIDVGTSGGISGAANGFAMMVGGDSTSVAAIAPILEVLSQPTGGYQLVGPAGAGHYVKMVHNAIEYGVMESLAEGYQLLKDGPYAALDLVAIGNLWQQNSIIASNLNALTAEALAANPNLDGINGTVSESGEARWALEVGQGHGLHMPDIEAALQVRLASQQGQVSFATKLLAAMRNAFGGHNLNANNDEGDSHAN